MTLIHARPTLPNIMGAITKPFVLLRLLLLSFIFASAARNPQLSSSNPTGSTTGLQTYIVHVAPPKANPIGFTLSTHKRSEWYYRSFLPRSTAASDDSTGADRLVHAYGHVASAFAARLTEDEVVEMSTKPGFLRANLDRTIPLTTTHTPDFLGMGFHNGFINGSNFGTGVIIGVLDTGITPNHTSFDGSDMPPPPAKWKGRCDFTGGRTCNNKLIGARNFVGTDMPFDYIGHGTHTASTAAGRPVSADVLGNAGGVATGMAPKAHLAIYKVCATVGCSLSAILAGMDTAVADGVDILSISIGGGSLPFYDDDMAIGAFGAVSKGVFVSCAAGNGGPIPSSLTNEAPWIFTVGASTMDRNIRAAVFLGNKLLIDGETLYQPADFSDSGPYPLVFPGGKSGPNPFTAFCANGSLSSMDVKGKVVICMDRGGVLPVDKGAEVLRAGGVAMILLNQEFQGDTVNAAAHVLPASNLGYNESVDVLSYVNSTANPTATIVFRGTFIGDAIPAPEVAAFSSRGPSRASPGILKPDIIGPGVNVLAAWPFPVGPSSATLHATWPPFNIISGTSMATPHLAGIAALLKAANPTWTPAMIKSAIMTSSDLMSNSGEGIADEKGQLAGPFALGAGHVNPTNANDPGLVYDTSTMDYVPYLCGLGYSSKQVSAVVHFPVNCARVINITEGNLNYPSISVVHRAADTVKVTRRVSNVGSIANETYRAAVVPGSNLGTVIVEPSTVVVDPAVKGYTFTVTFVGDGGGSGTVGEGQLYWTSEKHVVRSPIIVFNQ